MSDSKTDQVLLVTKAMHLLDEEIDKLKTEITKKYTEKGVLQTELTRLLNATG